MTQSSSMACGRAGVARRAGRSASALACCALFLLAMVGCANPHVLPPDQRTIVDRKEVESPAGFDLELYAVGLNGPTGMTFDADGNLIVAEGAIDGGEPRIYGFTPNLQRFEIYPLDKSILPLAPRKFRLYGPIGSIVYFKGQLYVAHRDENDFGVITALDYKGGHKTIVAGLPAQGEHGVTDMAIDQRGGGRLYFGVGSATNSGVVGMDDFAMGWVKSHPEVHDIPYTPDHDYVLWGRRMNSPNPFALWLMPQSAVSAALQAFGLSNKTRIHGATLDNPKCNSAILSCAVDGGDLRVEAHGIRLPSGMAFNDYGVLYFTNQGMEARGTRPVNNDPDTLCRLYPGPTPSWFGSFDYTADLQPITNANFQPPLELILQSGYSDLSFLIDHQASGLSVANARDVIYGTFSSQSGAASVTFVPSNGPFRDYAGSAIVALFGDRAPFATSGQKMLGPVGFKLARVDVDRGQGVIRDFVKNVQPGPASAHGGSKNQLERPICVRFGTDGSLYILDFGQMRMKDGQPDVKAGTGRIFRMFPSRGAAPATP